jgi:hypothetical protein
VRLAFGLLFYYVCQWCLMGFAFYLLARAFADIPADKAGAVLGAYAGACVIGTIAVFAPSGLGVREGALALFLSPLVPVPTVVAIALAARVWYSLVELGSGLVALAVLGRIGVRWSAVSPTDRAIHRT